jgi:hypothetical protein
MTRKLLVLVVPLILIVIVPQVYGVYGMNAGSGSAQIQQKLKAIGEEKTAAITQLKNTIKTNAAEARAEFKAKLETIKDEKKKLLVGRIDSKIAEINKRTTDRYLKTLEQLQMFVDRVSASDAATLANRTAAQNAINAAKTAVEAQAAKTYTIEITDEETLKTNVGTVVSQFRKDLTTVHELIVKARLSVVKLYASRVIRKEEATKSAAQRHGANE